MEKGEEIMASIISFCHENNIRNGTITAIGAAKNLKLGYYDILSGKYICEDFEDEYEITSLNGNISLLDGNPFPHIHIQISGRDFKCIGGHLFSAIVSITCEFIIESFDSGFSRKADTETGLNLIDFSL